MQVAFHLRRRTPALPASALLLRSHQPADLIRLLVRLGGDALPAVYAVAEGFLLKLPMTYAETFDHAVRLRALSDNLFVPVDADLLPALLPDEAAALGRRRGLVFLPGNSVLEFDPTTPFPLARLFRAGMLHRRPWQPLPMPEPIAERLTEITLVLRHKLNDG